MYERNAPLTIEVYSKLRRPAPPPASTRIMAFEEIDRSARLGNFVFFGGRVFCFSSGGDARLGALLFSGDWYLLRALAGGRGCSRGCGCRRGGNILKRHREERL